MCSVWSISTAGSAASPSVGSATLLVGYPSAGCVVRTTVKYRALNGFAANRDMLSYLALPSGAFRKLYGLSGSGGGHLGQMSQSLGSLVLRYKYVSLTSVKCIAVQKA